MLKIFTTLVLVATSIFGLKGILLDGTSQASLAAVSDEEASQVFGGNCAKYTTEEGGCGNGPNGSCPMTVFKDLGAGSTGITVWSCGACGGMAGPNCLYCGG